MRPLHRHRRAHARGAVLVEFVVALMPLMTTFFFTLQLMQLATAKLVVKHAALVGARGAAVISNKNGNTPDQAAGDNVADIRTGVELALGPWRKTMAKVDVEVDDRSSCQNQYGPVAVTVRADYKCSVPFGNLLCRMGGNGTSVRTLTQRYAFPHQGARYHDGGGSSCQAAGGP